MLAKSPSSSMPVSCTFTICSVVRVGGLGLGRGALAGARSWSTSTRVGGGTSGTLGEQLPPAAEQSWSKADCARAGSAGVAMSTKANAAEMGRPKRMRCPLHPPS